MIENCLGLNGMNQYACITFIFHFIQNKLSDEEGGREVDR